MSQVNNYLLIVSILDDTAGDSALPSCVAAINAYLTDPVRSTSQHNKFSRVDNHAGGNKGMEIGVFALGANYLSLHMMAQAVLYYTDWEQPEGVELIYRGQHNDESGLYRLSDLRVVEDCQ